MTSLGINSGITITILDVINHPVFYLKKNYISKTGFCLHLQVEPTYIGPIERAILCLRTVDRD
jgi:hypothetical protein